jgi:hypothetical protein
MTMLKYLFASALTATFALTAFADDPALPPAKLDPVPRPLKSDPSVKIDYDIVYVRAPRFVAGPNGKQRPSRWPEIGHPTNIDAGYDLMLLHPDGSEELLVAGGEGSIADPFVSFDAEWVYYAHFYLGKLGAGSDIYKVHVKSKKSFASHIRNRRRTPVARRLSKWRRRRRMARSARACGTLARVRCRAAVWRSPARAIRSVCRAVIRAWPISFTRWTMSLTPNPSPIRDEEGPMWTRSATSTSAARCIRSY